MTQLKESVGDKLNIDSIIKSNLNLDQTQNIFSAYD